MANETNPNNQVPVLRDKEENGINFQLHIGASSILLIFVTLCLVSFAVLSIVSANADKKLTDKVTDRTAEYYRACNTAESALSIMDQSLAEAYRNTSSAAEYFEAVGEEDNYNFYVDINPKQKLLVTVHVLYPENEGDPFYRISRWQVIDSAPQTTEIE